MKFDNDLFDFAYLPLAEALSAERPLSLSNEIW
jgi:hypothetical protein